MGDHIHSAPLTRRAFMAGGASCAVLASPVLAQLDLGPSATLTTVSDGHLTLPPSMMFGNLPQAELAEILTRNKIDPASYTPACNPSLYRDGTNTVLFDVGAGPDFMGSAGQLPDTLDAMGITPEDVTHVVFTHAHPDHLWGVLDDFDDPFFANASHLFGRAEWDYWWNPETINTIGDDRASFAAGAKRRMEVIEDMVDFIDDGQEFLPGVTAHASYGHTPGHLAFEIAASGSSAMIVGDAIGNPHVAFERPDWHSASDQDPETGAKTRARLLDRLATDQMPVIGFHLPGTGIGRVEKTSTNYRFVGDPA